MILLPSLSLEANHSANLVKWQKEVDAKPDYEARVAAGKAAFKARNVLTNATFSHVKTVLTRMCQGARRCAYCEDSVADEVEHIQPKDLYPGAVFRWENYLYACGPCNGPKNNKYAVVQGDPPSKIEVTRQAGAPIVPPATGEPALINPRIEDPLRFLFLDLLNTFTFTILPGLLPADALRASFTLEVLRLNERDYLIEARRTAFGTYRARLREYLDEKGAGAPPAALQLRRNELLRVGHQTVWREMQRQHQLHPVLRALFAAAPEALEWK